MTLLTLAQSLLVGGATGFLSGLLGVGGGFIMIPLLTAIGVPIHLAVGTCLAFVACSSLAGLVQHARQGTIDVLAALLMTLPAALMANVGARFSSLLAPGTLYLLFGFLMASILAMYYFAPLPQALEASSQTETALPWYIQPRRRVLGDVPYVYTIHTIHAVLCGMGTGTLTGVFGIGGGVLLVPLSVVILKIPLRITAGTSLAVFVLPAWIGTVTHWRLGNVDVSLGIPLVVTGMLAGQLGARYVMLLPPEVLKRFFLLLVSAGSVFMLVRGLLE